MNLLEATNYYLTEENADKMTYLGQCNKVRLDDESEQKWQDMMNDKEEIDIQEFDSLVDFSPLLDDGETLESWYNDNKQSDPDTAAYTSHWGDIPCAFVATSGFEFIFIK